MPVLLKRTPALLQPRGCGFRHTNPSAPQTRPPSRCCAVVRRGHEQIGAQKPCSFCHGAVSALLRPSCPQEYHAAQIKLSAAIQLRFHHLKRSALAAFYPDHSAIEINHLEPRHAPTPRTRPRLGTHRYREYFHNGLFAGSARSVHAPGLGPRGSRRGATPVK